MMVPLVKTPREVYIGPLGFFFTLIKSRLKVALSSGCVTWALVNRNPEGRINRSYFGGFRVNPGPTNVAFVIILFHCLAIECKKKHGNLADNSVHNKQSLCRKILKGMIRILTLAFPSSENFEHLVFGHGSYLNVPKIQNPESKQHLKS